MEKLLTLIFCVTITNIAFTQKLKEYKASNGIAYQIGDTITLGKGSAPNGDFNYLQMGGFYNTMSAISGDYNDIANGVGRNYSGLNVVIKKINQQKFKGAIKIVFVVGGGNITNYNLMIEDAIAAGEIKSFGMTSDEALTELKRCKDKFDLGLITQEKYDSIKAILVKYIK